MSDDTSPDDREKQSDGKTILGIIGRRVWAFKESLHITGPDTEYPCEGGHFSPYAVDFSYVYDPDSGWQMAPGRLIGPRVLGDEMGDAVHARFDEDYMYSCPALDDGCPHDECSTPAWVLDLAARRMALLPAPPVIS